MISLKLSFVKSNIKNLKIRQMTEDNKIDAVCFFLHYIFVGGNCQEPVRGLRSRSGRNGEGKRLERKSGRKCLIIEQ